jgi:exonuclease SbcC
VIKIKKVKISNFQSHENTILDFEDGLNVITGPSDQGKSAIIRAIKWALYNEPRGTEFIRYGMAGVKVEIEFSNGYRVVRERTKSKNRYIVFTSDGSETVFEGFGNDVPDEVVKAHGMPKVMLDKDYISNLNISEQIEGPFLLSEPGSIRAKAIGRLTGMHIIDKAIRDCIVDIRRENQTRERLIKEMKIINKTLETYGDLDILKNKIDSVDNSLTIIAGLLNKMSRLDALEKKLSALKEQYRYVERVLGITDRLDECAKLLATASEYIVKLKKLENLNRRYEEYTNNVHKITDNLKQNRQDTDKLINSYASLLKDIAVCPFCGSEISGSIVDNIVSHYKGIHQ